MLLRALSILLGVSEASTGDKGSTPLESFITSSFHIQIQRGDNHLPKVYQQSPEPGPLDLEFALLQWRPPKPLVLERAGPASRSALLLVQPFCTARACLGSVMLSHGCGPEVEAVSCLLYESCLPGSVIEAEPPEAFPCRGKELRKGHRNPSGLL